MFKLEKAKVTRCPITEQSVGVIRLKPEHIGMLAGAVKDSIEWMVLLHGKRSEDGYEVDVEKITAPKQSRNGTEAVMEELDLPADVVGVVHSHHTMGAFFSGTDTSTLNPRFATSIVVATGRNNFGFSYKAEGKVKLPCGSPATIEFEIAVADDEQYDLVPLRPTHEGEVSSLMSCPHVLDKPISKYEAAHSAECGLTEAGVHELNAVFGTEAAEMLAEIQSQTIRPTQPSRPSGYIGSYGYGGGYGGHFGFTEGLSKKERKKLKGLKGSDTRPYALKSGCDVCKAKPPKIYYYRELKKWICGACADAYEQALELRTEEPPEKENGNEKLRVL